MYIIWGSLTFLLFEKGRTIYLTALFIKSDFSGSLNINQTFMKKAQNNLKKKKNTAETYILLYIEVCISETLLTVFEDPELL